MYHHPTYVPTPSRGALRKRISMACQHCRHRKIRCYGGSPCTHCERSKRKCEYAPVPKEVSRVTREKKAFAKAAKLASQSIPPMTTSIPYSMPRANFEELLYDISTHSSPFTATKSSFELETGTTLGSKSSFETAQSAVRIDPSMETASSSYPSVVEHLLLQSLASHQLGIQLEPTPPCAQEESPAWTTSSVSAPTCSTSPDEGCSYRWIQTDPRTPEYTLHSPSSSLPVQITNTCPAAVPTDVFGSKTATPPTPSLTSSPPLLSLNDLFASYPSVSIEHQPLLQSPTSTHRKEPSPMISGDCGLSTRESFEGLGLIDGTGHCMCILEQGQSFLSIP
nr:hypothetical protein L204_05697 [Cryptococcus depauperatus CBS 7855]